jgi:hypothetical protein
VNVPAGMPESAQSCVRASRGKMPCFVDFMAKPYTLLVSAGGFPEIVPDTARIGRRAAGDAREMRARRRSKTAPSSSRKRGVHG